MNLRNENRPNDDNWPHIGQCPFCSQGLARIRKCEDECAGVHFFALCDECDAIWLRPSTESPKQFPDSENPQCPICHADLFGDQSAWATEEELEPTVWAVAIQPPKAEEE